MHILFVENHDSFPRVATQVFLSEHDVTIIPSLSGARRLLADFRFDIVLMDYDLDDGKGDELVCEMRHTHPLLPIIAVSSHDRGNEALACAGAVVVCAKTDFGQICNVLEKVSNERVKKMNGAAETVRL